MNKIHNYFGAYDTVNNKMLICVHTYEEQDIWKDISSKYFNTPEYAEKFSKDPYSAIYKTDLKKYLEDVAPYVLEDLLYQYVISDSCVKGYNPILDDKVEIRLATQHDYKEFYVKQFSVNEDEDNE